MLEGPDNVVSDGGASMRRLGLGDRVPLDEQLGARSAADREGTRVRKSSDATAGGSDFARRLKTIESRQRRLSILVPSVGLVEALPA